MSSESIFSDSVPAVSLDGLLISPKAGLRGCAELKADRAKALSIRNPGQWSTGTVQKELWSIRNPGQDPNWREQDAEHLRRSLKDVESGIELFRSSSQQ